MTSDAKKLEAQFFNSLNQMVEPLVRAGFGFPCFAAAGAVVLETRGRKSGAPRNVPLVATRVGNLLLVSTVRRGSQWVRNLAANPQTRYWLGGRVYEAEAFVFPAFEIENQAAQAGLPESVAALAQILLPQSRLFGVSFAILAPRQG